MTEDTDTDENEPLVPPLGDPLKEAFSGPQYDDQNDFEKEYKLSLQLWEEFPTTKYKSRGIITCLCLNVDIDPEEWREDLAREVPIARREGDINAWYNSDDTDSHNRDRDNDYDAIQKTLKRNYTEYVGRHVSAASFQWKQLHNKTASKDSILSSARHIHKNPYRQSPSQSSENIVCFHYNGHDVPRPTKSGEIWVFSRHMDQYHPLNVPTELATELGPAIYIWDCCNAGLIIEKFNEKYEGNFRNFHFAACGATEFRPIKKEIPADIFTACLTNPIKTALKWALEKDSASIICPDITPKMIDNHLTVEVFGEKKDRKTLHGELGWIMTGLLEAIAWDSMTKSEKNGCPKWMAKMDGPKRDQKMDEVVYKNSFKLFHDCFRCDSLLSALYRYFVLADRILRSYGCNPQSDPALPKSMHNHHLWKSWDAIVDNALTKLQNNLKPDPLIDARHQSYFNVKIKDTRFQFYDQQLLSFENWINIPRKRTGAVEKPPVYLPLALQAILELAPRIKALTLFARYMDSGPSAIYNTLAGGLNQEPSSYLMRLLEGLKYDNMPHFWTVFIWTKLIAFQNKVEPKLWQAYSKDAQRGNNAPKKKESHRIMNYFFQVLNDPDQDNLIRAQSAFIIARICEEKEVKRVQHLQQPGQIVCSAQKDIFEIFSRQESFPVGNKTIHITQLWSMIDTEGYCPNQGDSLLRKWLLILIGRLWDNFSEARNVVDRGDYIKKIIAFAQLDEDPEVRAAAVYATGTYLGCQLGDQIVSTESKSRLISFAAEIGKLTCDACWLVRKEIVYSLQLFITQYQDNIIRDLQKIFKPLKTTGRPMGQHRRGSGIQRQTNPRMMQNQTDVPVDPKHYLKELKQRGASELFERPDHVIAKAIILLAMDPNQEVSRPAHDLFDAVFKNGRKNSSSEPSSEQDVCLLHAKNSPYFKYASKYWLRTLLYENIAHKPLDVQMQIKKNMLNEDGEIPAQLRNRTRSRPRNRGQREKEEQKVERDLAHSKNLKIYKRCNAMYNRPVDNLKRLVHYEEITEHINDMMFLPYSNALIAAGQTGLYLVDLDHLPYDVQEGEISGAQTRVFGSEKGTNLTSLTVLNQGTKPIIAVASNDGSIRLRKLQKQSNRLEIQDNVLTSWKVVTNEVGKTQNEIKIIWNEEILACSYRDTPETSCVTLWDGIQEKQITSQSIKQRGITCLALVGEESLKRGPLLLGGKDGNMYKFDMRSEEKVKVTQFGERVALSRTTGEVTGIETRGNEIMVGYSDATVKIWDARHHSREVSKISFAENESSGKQSHCFAGSIKMDFFVSDLSHNVFMQSIKSTESQNLFEKAYPIKNMTSNWGATRDIEIKNAIFGVVHPFCPYFALATSPKGAKGAISIWLPK